MGPVILIWVILYLEIKLFWLHAPLSNFHNSFHSQWFHSLNTHWVYFQWKLLQNKSLDQGLTSINRLQGLLWNPDPESGHLQVIHHQVLHTSAVQDTVGEGRPSSGQTPALSRVALLTDQSRLFKTNRRDNLTPTGSQPFWFDFSILAPFAAIQRFKMIDFKFTQCHLKTLEMKTYQNILPLLYLMDVALWQISVFRGGVARVRSFSLRL